MIEKKTSDSLLRDHGLRVTEVRKEVLEIFIDHDAALSHQDIENKMDEVDRITLYRTLRSFEEKGVIHKAIDGTNVAKYALCENNCTEHHHDDHHVHFHCEKCGNTFCMEKITIPHIPTPSGFKVKDTNVILQGLCEKCQ